jgi:hypothetical protein
MLSMRPLILAFAVSSVFAGTARAVDYEATGGTEHSYRHGGQFKLYSQLGKSYRIIFPYGSDYCGDEGKSYCRTFTPFWVELGAGYGITNSIEILTDVRLGLGRDFAPATSTTDREGPRVMVISPGLRLFIDDLGSLKFFSTVQVAIDITDYSKNAVSKSTDVGFRNVNGLLIDFHRTLGVYVHVGETFSFVRWFRFEIDGGIGLMVRLP